MSAAGAPIALWTVQAPLEDRMSSREDIVRKVTAELAKLDDVLDGYVFGSVARDDIQPHSDVDVALYLHPGAADSGFGRAAELAADLMRALGKDRVDVLVLNRASPLVYHRVLRDGIRVFARDLRAATTREGRALSRYCDYLPQLAKVKAATDRRRVRGAFGR